MWVATGSVGPIATQLWTPSCRRTAPRDRLCRAWCRLPSTTFGPVLAEDQDALLARDSDRAAARAQLDQAYRNEAGRLLRYVGSRAGHEAAADLVQEVFVRAAGSRQLGLLANPAGFLRRVARNLLIDRARSRRTRPVLLSLDEALDAPMAPEQALELEAADLLRQYEQSVAALPAKTRRVFLMHRVEGLTYRDIHLELRISISTVEYHMMKALAQIAVGMDFAA